MTRSLSPRISLALGALLLALTSCRPPDAALKVTVTLKQQGTAKVRADCIKLAVLDGTTEKKSLVIAKPASGDTLVFGVLQGTDLPKNVNLQVSGLLGKCTDETTLLLNAQTSLEPAVFPEQGVTPFEISLEPPGATLDSDRDGFVAASKGGPDCNDVDNTIFPGATQVCSNPADTDCDGKGGCDDSECGAAAFCSDPPDRVVMTTANRTMLRGQCLGPIHVELYNPVGPRKAVRDTPVLFASSVMGVTTHTTSSCADAPVDQLTIAFDTTAIDVYLKADEMAFGTDRFSATAFMVPMAGSLDIEVHPRPVTGIRFTSMPQTLQAGVCGATPVTLEFFDAMNTRTDVDAPTTVNLSSMPNDLMNAAIFYSDAACTTVSTASMLTAGQGLVTAYVKVKRAGTFTLTAAPSIGTSATQMLTVTPAAPVKLAFTNNPLAILTTQTCSSGTLALQLQDPFDNAATLASPFQVTMSTVGPSPLQFYPGSDTVCTTTAATTFTIPANMSGITLRVASLMMPGMNTVTATPTLATPPLTPASQTLFVSAGAATHYTWSGTAQSPLAGTCSANPLTIELKDSQGNPTSSASALTFGLSTSPVADASFRYFSGAGCVTDLNGSLTIPAGQTSAQVFFRGNKVFGPFEVRWGTSLIGPTTPAAGNAVLANVPAKLAFGSPLSQNAQAGICTASAYVVNVLDQYDNPTVFTSAQTLTVTSNPANVTIGQGAACDGSTAPLAANSGTTSFTAKHTVTTPSNPYQLTATVSGFSTATPATLNVTPGNVTLQVDNPLNAATTVTAGTCQNVTVSRRDQFGNNAPTGGSTPVVVTFPTSTQWDLYPQPNCMGTLNQAPTMNSTYTSQFSVRPKTAGSHMVSVSAAGNSAPIAFTVNPGTPSLVFETPNTGTSTANASQTAGGCTQVTVARKDTYGNDVPLGSAQNLTFTLATGTTAHSNAGCSAPIANIALTATDARATFWVQATVSSPTGSPGMQSVVATLASQSATLTLTVSSAASVLALTAPSGGTASVAANTPCVQVGVERRDMFGNPVQIPGGVTSMAVTGSANLSAFDATNCTGPAIAVNPSPGAAVTVTPGAFAETFSVRATLAGTYPITVTLNGQSVPLTVTVTPGPLAVLLVENVPSTFTAGGCSAQINVRRRDNFTNDITADPAITVALTATKFSFSPTVTTCASPVPTTNVLINAGSAVSTDAVYLTGTQSGAASVTATYMAINGTANSTINAASATQLVSLTTPSALTSGTCSPSVQIELRDTYGNQVVPAVGSPVPITTSSTASATFFNVAACGAGPALQLTNAAPRGTFSFRPIAATSHDVTASAGGPLTVTQTWSVGPGGANKLFWRQDPTTAPTRFACVSAGIIEVRDANDNPTTNGTGSAITVTPTTTGGNANLTFYTDATCTTVLTTTTIAQNAGATAEFFMLGTGGTSATAVAATAPSMVAAPNRSVAVGGAQGSITVSPANPDVEAGACVALTVTRNDAAAAALAKGATTVNFTSSSGSITLHSATDCTGAALASFAFTHGTSSTTVYARGRSATQGATPVDVTFTAADPTAGSTSGTSTLKAYPLVRRATCSIAAAQTGSRCAVAPPIPGKDISRSFLLVSSTGRPATTSPNAIGPKDQNVECHLENGNADVEVVCTRVGTNGAMAVNYQVVSFGRDAASGFGATVQRFQVATSTSTATTTQAITAVDTSKSFLLQSSTLGGDLNDSEGFPLVKFTSTGAAVSSVDIVSPTATPTMRTVSFEVVTLGLTGIAVDHRSVTNPALSSTTYNITTNNLASANSFAIAAVQVNDGSTNPENMCKRRLNAKVTSNTNVALHRGSGTQPANCTAEALNTAYVQRVFSTAMNATTVADVTFNNNQNAAQTSTTFTAVAKDRSIVFLGTQGPGGLCAGEANFVGSGFDADDTGPFHATVDFNGAGTAVVVTREVPATNITSTFSPQVVTFNP